MNHCYRDASSTIVDAERHLPDTQRGAIRHFARLLPTESGHGGRLMPLGRPGGAARAPVVGTDLVRHLLRNGQSIRGEVTLDAVEPVATEPMVLNTGIYQLTVRLDLAGDAADAAGHDGAFEVRVVFDDLPLPDVVTRHDVRALGWTGSLHAAEVNLFVPKRATVHIALRALSGQRLVVRHLLLKARGATVPEAEFEMVG